MHSITKENYISNLNQNGMNSISTSLPYEKNYNNNKNKQTYKETISSPPYDHNYANTINKKVYNEENDRSRNRFWNEAEERNKNEFRNMNKNFSPQKPNIEANDTNVYDMFYDDKQKYLQKKMYSNDIYAKKEEKGNSFHQKEGTAKNNEDFFPKNFAQKLKNDNNESFSNKSQNKIEETQIQQKVGKKHFFENAGMQILATQNNVNNNLLAFDNVDLSDNVGKKTKKNFIKENQEISKPKNIYDNFNEKLKHLDTLKKKYADNRKFDSSQFSNNNNNNNYNGEGPSYRQCLENRVLANKDKVKNSFLCKTNQLLINYFIIKILIKRVIILFFLKNE